MKLSMEEIKDFEVPKKSLAVWWLGQASFIVKSPEGIIAAIDPYLTDSCKEAVKPMGIDFARQITPPLQPEELVGIDLYVLTHSHQDHFDPDTFEAYTKAGGQGPFVAPGETVEKLLEKGVPKEKITMVWPNKSCTVGDLRLRATFAIPFGGDDLTHIGYLVSSKDGPIFYFTGDTGYHEVMGISVAEHKPDVLFAVMNGIFKNMSPAEAAKLAKDIDAKVVIPCHHDLFPDGTMPPNLLKMNLLLYDMQNRYKLLKHGEVLVYPS